MPPRPNLPRTQSRSSNSTPPSLSSHLVPYILTQLKARRNADIRVFGRELQDALSPARRSLANLWNDQYQQQQQQRSTHPTHQPPRVLQEEPKEDNNTYLLPNAKQDIAATTLDATICGFITNALGHRLIHWYNEVDDLAERRKSFLVLASNEETRLQTLQVDCEELLQVFQRTCQIVHESSSYTLDCVQVAAGVIENCGLAFERYGRIAAERFAVEQSAHAVMHLVENLGSADDDDLEGGSAVGKAKEESQSKNQDWSNLTKARLLDLLHPFRSPGRTRISGIIVVRPVTSPINMVNRSTLAASYEASAEESTDSSNGVSELRNMSSANFLAHTILSATGLRPDLATPLNAHLHSLLPSKFTQIPPLLRAFVDRDRASGDHLRYDEETEAGLAFVQGLGGVKAECRIAPYQDALFRVMREYWLARDRLQGMEEVRGDDVVEEMELS